MDINSVNNSSIYSSKPKAEGRKPNMPLPEARSTNNTPVDRLELSDEAKLAGLLELEAVQGKIKSGFYENPEVLGEVASRLVKELSIKI